LYLAIKFGFCNVVYFVVIRSAPYTGFSFLLLPRSGVLWRAAYYS
jgi:hypothetical protein